MQKTTSIEMDTLVNQAIETCDQLIGVLQQEKAIIITGNVEQLEEQNLKKVSLLEKLTSYDEELRTNEEILRNADRQLGIKWELLRQKLITCKQHSAINGSMVNHCLKNTTDALALLRGSGNNGCITYSNDGKPNQDLDSKAIAKI